MHFVKNRRHNLRDYDDDMQRINAAEVNSNGKVTANIRRQPVPFDTLS